MINPRVLNVFYQSPFKLILTFTNREVREFDFESYLDFPVYSVLKNDAFCKNVKVFNGTVIWDDQTDFDPDTLYIESKPLVTA